MIKKIKLITITISMIISLFIGKQIIPINAVGVNVTLGGNTGYSINVRNADGVHTQWSANYEMIMINGEYGFCVEPGVVLVPGGGFTPIDRSDWHTMSIIAFEGWEKSNKTKEDYLATQLMIWESMGATILSTSFNVYGTYKSIIQDRINKHFIKPSFAGVDYEVNVGQTIRIPDVNDVLDNFTLVQNDGLDVRIEGNELVITGTIGAKDNSKIRIQKFASSLVGTSIAYNKAGSQSVAVFKISDPLWVNINVKVNKYIDVTLNKEDLETGKDYQGDASLNGAEYGLFKSDNTLIESKIIKEDLKIKFEKLMVTDTYYIKETKAPIGYNLNDEKIEINPLELLNSGAVGSDLQYKVTSKEKIVKGNLSIYKTISEGESGVLRPVAKAEFNVKLKSEVDKVGWDNAKSYGLETTDKTGFAHFKDLVYGRYVVKETKTPDEVNGSDPFEIVIDEEGKTAFRAINNEPFKAWLRIINVDETGERITYDNASYSLLNEKGEIVKQKVGNEFVEKFDTNKNAEVTLPLQLSVKEKKQKTRSILKTDDVLELAKANFTIDEKKIPNGFLKADEVKFTISKDSDYVLNEDNEPVVIVYVVNKKPFAKVIVNKTYENEIDNGLGGTTFKVKANSKILNQTNGEVLFDKGDILNIDNKDGLYSINESGQLEVSKLPMSVGNVSYVLNEFSTLDGYVLDKDDFVFDFKQNDFSTKEYILSKNIRNELSRIKVVKKDGITGDLLKGVELELLDKNKNMIESFVSDEKGKILKGLKVNELYFIREKRTLEGYQKINDLQFIVKDVKGVQEIVVYNFKKIGKIHTGDNSNIKELLIVFCLVSFLIIMYIVYSVCRKKEEIKNDK